LTAAFPVSSEEGLDISRKILFRVIPVSIGSASLPVLSGLFFSSRDDCLGRQSVLDRKLTDVQRSDVTLGLKTKDVKSKDLWKTVLMKVA
jgi:hypothetical protein